MATGIRKVFKNVNAILIKEIGWNLKTRPIIYIVIENSDLMFDSFKFEAQSLLQSEDVPQSSCQSKNSATTPGSEKLILD